MKTISNNLLLYSICLFDHFWKNVCRFTVYFNYRQHPLGVCMSYIIWIHFLASNNIAEYESLVNGLHIATELGIWWLGVWGDSQLIVDQVMKEPSCHEPKMASYC
jgi:hypothetical protein